MTESELSNALFYTDFELQSFEEERGLVRVFLKERDRRLHGLDEAKIKGALASAGASLSKHRNLGTTIIVKYKGLSLPLGPVDMKLDD